MNLRQNMLRKIYIYISRRTHIHRRAHTLKYTILLRTNVAFRRDRNSVRLHSALYYLVAVVLLLVEDMLPKFGEQLKHKKMGITEDVGRKIQGCNRVTICLR